ncbi:MAG: hypothetical protein EBU30_07840 [Synechococcaceae bacterium WB6_3B_236]|nr:hypothetical protein [Synechococcaceae bacterium WB6_3B_236]
MLLPLLLGQLALPAQNPGWDWPGPPSSLIRLVTEGSYQAMITDFKQAYGLQQMPSVTVTNRCERTSYNRATSTVCLSPAMISGLARLGDGALVFVVAHELGHHLQNSIPQIVGPMPSRTQRELQADCLAGILLSRNVQLRMSDQDVQEALTAAQRLGDSTYDHFNHHGSGEMRMLAVRSGMRYGRLGQRDNYFPLFCGLQAGGTKNRLGS